MALHLAEQAGGTIINADASQLYRDLSVLSARPASDEESRAPHRLFGTVDGAKPCSAAEWALMAKASIAQAHDKGSLPILVGGTGLYIRTLLDGIAPVPAIDPTIRTEVRNLSVQESYAALQTLDPVSAAKLRPGDTTRIARALEVVRATGISLNEWQRRKEGGIADSIALKPLILLPPREWLYARADTRFAQMLEQGAIAEVETLLSRALDPALPVMRAIGVREIGAWLAGEISWDAMKDAAATATRQYAKRQYTWFSRQPPGDWPRHEETLDDEILNKLVIKLL